MSRAHRFGHAADVVVVTAVDGRSEHPFLLFEEWETEAHGEAYAELPVADAVPIEIAPE